MRTTKRIATTVWALALVGLSAAPLGAQTTEQKGGPQEGIKVHGHWTITVRNTDGTIASSREFENALISDQYGGNGLLAALLTRNLTNGVWVVSLDARTGPKPCIWIGGDSDGSLLSCDVTEGRGVLTVTRPTPTTVQLTGETRANNSEAAVIDYVRTVIGVCAGTDSPQLCASGQPANWMGGFSFSGMVLSPAIAVRVNQVIQFTVVFSFS